jgi:hypothetical protein
MSALAIQGVKELDAKLKAPMTLSGTTSVAGAVLPTEDNVYDLGSPDKRFKSIYLGPGTIYMMQDNGTQVSLGFSEEGINKDKFVLRGSDGKEVVLTGGSGGGSCGLLCSVLTARVVDGRAQLAPAVPDVDLGIATNRLRTVFADTVNVSAITFPMETRELATASVGKTLGVISADGVSARIGLVDSMDARTDVLVADMARAKNDIAMLKAQLASVQAALAMKVKEVGVCRSESIPVLITKTVGSGDWVILQATPPIF